MIILPHRMVCNAISSPRTRSRGAKAELSKLEFEVKVTCDFRTNFPSRSSVMTNDVCSHRRPAGRQMCSGHQAQMMLQKTQQQVVGDTMPMGLFKAEQQLHR